MDIVIFVTQAQALRRMYITVNIYTYKTKTPILPQTIKKSLISMLLFFNSVIKTTTITKQQHQNLIRPKALFSEFLCKIGHSVVHLIEGIYNISCCLRLTLMDLLNKYRFLLILSLYKKYRLLVLLRPECDATTAHPISRFYEPT